MFTFQALEQVSDCVIDNSFLSIIIDKCSKVLEAESHEGTLLQCVAVLHSWLHKATAPLQSATLKPLADNFQVASVIYLASLWLVLIFVRCS